MNEDTNKDVKIVGGNDTGMHLDKMKEDSSSSHTLTEKPEIRGWLKVFLYVLGLNCVFGVIGLLVNIIPDPYKGSVVFQVAGILRWVFVICLSIIAINKFVKRAPNAIFYAQVLLVMCALNNIMYVFLDSDADDVWKSVVGLLWWVIWFFFLDQSSLVREIYPPESRKVQSKDWVVAAACILIPWTIFLAGYLDDNNSIRSQNSEEVSTQAGFTTKGINPSTLMAGELTDGNIAFKIPSSFVTEKHYADDMKTRMLYTFNNGSKQSVYGLLTSYKLKSWNKAQFSQTWETWKDDNLLKLPSKTLFDGSYSLKGSTCYERQVSYQGNVKIFLDLATVYNEESHKLCLVRIEYAEGEKNPMKEILESVRFK